MDDLLHILILEDRTQDAELLLHELRKNRFQFEWRRVQTEEDFNRALTPLPDIILADYSMPQFDATRALEILRERQLDIPFIIISGTIGEDAAVLAMKAGAHDFFAKNKLTRLAPAIERELRDARERRQRKETEKLLGRAEERFAKAFQASPVAIIVSRMEDGRLIDVNIAFLTMLGYTREDVIGRTVYDINLWANLDERAYVMQMLRERGSLRDFEIKVRGKSGEIHDTLTSLEAIDLDDGACVLALLHDITERKRAQGAVERSNQRLRMLHTIDQAILSTRSESVVVSLVLQYFLREMPVPGASIVAFDFESREGRVFAMTRGDETPEIRRFALEEWPLEDISALQDGTTQMIEDASAVFMPPGVQVLHKDGLHAYLRVPLIAQGDLIGTLNLAATSTDDLTLEYREIANEIADQVAIAVQQARLDERIRRHADELEQRVIERTAELEWAKRRAESILHNSSDAIIVADTDGIIQQTNPGFHELFGYQPDDAFGLSVATLVEEEYAEAIGQTFDAVVLSNQRVRLEVRCRSRDGTTVVADMVIAPLPERPDEQRNVICSIRDITERKRMEEELRQALENERELNELKSRFVSIVSHEFRTPLTAILSSSQLLKLYRDRMSVDRQIDHLDKIETQVRRLTDLLNDVLTLSKAEAVGFEFFPLPLDLGVFCRNLAEEIQVITKTPHQIVFSMAGTCEGFQGDEKLLRHIVTNLLTNAVKYSPQASSVQFDLVCEDDAVIIRVKDDGLGIPEEDQRHLFEAFHRAKNVRDIPGTGLGLPIVKRAVDAHGGTISMESQEGTGTTFTVRLPFLH